MTYQDGQSESRISAKTREIHDSSIRLLSVDMSVRGTWKVMTGLGLLVAVGVAGLIWIGLRYESDRRQRIRVVEAMQYVKDMLEKAHLNSSGLGSIDRARLGLPESVSQSAKSVDSEYPSTDFVVDIADSKLVVTFGADQDDLSGRTLVLVRKRDSPNLGWHCASSVPTRYVPGSCRKE